MKRYYYFILFLFLSTIFNTKVNAQHVDAGPDRALCNGETEVTLHGNVGRIMTGRYRVESIPFSWDADFSTAQDVMLNGTPLRIDDKYGDVVDLPFPISFYGRTYDQIVIGTNGDIIFETSVAGEYDAWSISATELIPNHTLPYWSSTGSLSFASIMGAYHDIYMSSTYMISNSAFKYKTVGSAPNRKFIVIYDVVPQFSCTTTYSSQEIVFNENDFSIEVHIKNKPVCSTWQDGRATLGIQNEELLPDTCGNYPGDVTSTALPNRNTGVWEIPETAPEAYKFVPDANVVLTWYDGNRNVVGHDVDVTVPFNGTETYTLEASFEDCHGNLYNEFDEVTVRRIADLQLEMPTSSTLCANETLHLDGTAGNESDYTNITYTWTDDTGTTIATTPTLDVTTAGTYTLTVDADGCIVDFEIVVDAYPYACKVPEGISPNGDGDNDYFELSYLANKGEGIDKLEIYDRRGVLVYEKDGYANEFVGKTNDDKELPAATYFYVIKMMDGEKITGWLYIVR
jgi:gliding motility-associated-like protein